VTLLADLVATSEAVAATRARSAKVARLADLLGRLAADEVVAAVALLSGEPRQGRIGVGWATLAAVQAAAAGSGGIGPSLSVLDLDAALERLAALSGPGSAAARAATLRALFDRATPAEAGFLRRLLSGDLRQGALEGVMAEAVARSAGVPAAEVRRAAMLAGDLARVAALALAGAPSALGAVGLRVLSPLQPMLAATAADVGEALEGAGGGPASVEWKLDGARVQVHRDGDEVAVFTRSLHDATARLPGIVALARSLPAGRFVLDGEAIGLGEEDRPGRFQDTMSRFSRDDGGGAAGGGGGLAVRFFDCLHLDGDDLLDRPLAERAEALARVAGPWRVPSIVTADPAEAEAFLAGALAAGHEGVMVKAVDSPYEAGRRGGVWRKVKRVRTLDLVVLAAEWGHGRRTGWLSNLHLGARAGGPGGEPGGGFVMVGKTFKGLTDDLLAWQTAELLARERGRDGIVVHVRPELVVEVALDGVQASTRYPGGVALRFARVRRYRQDKTPAEADTIATVRALLPA
jgi:DNA ligase-1